MILLNCTTPFVQLWAGVKLSNITTAKTGSPALSSSITHDVLTVVLSFDDRVLREGSPTLGVGEGIDVGLLIDTHETALGTYDETLTVVADQP